MALKVDRSSKKKLAHPCPACGSKGVVDYMDLVRGRAELHCRSCPTTWAEQAQATMPHLASHLRN